MKIAETTLGVRLPEGFSLWEERGGVVLFFKSTRISFFSMTEEDLGRRIERAAKQYLVAQKKTER